MTILLLEDNEADVSLWRAIIGSQARLLTAARVQDGLLIEAKERPNICVIDAGLLDAHGIEGIKMMLRQNPMLPVVATSGNEEDEFIAELLAAGAIMFMPKPPHLKVLKLLFAIRWRHRRLIEAGTRLDVLTNTLSRAVS